MLQCTVTNLTDTHPKKGGRDNSLKQEQSFCRDALESGEYDRLSDEEWVALCERVSVTARNEKAQHPEIEPAV